MWKLQFIAFLKYLGSFFKRNWELRDYPIRLTQQDTNLENSAPSWEHFEFFLWRAQVVNWWQMIGSGNTRDEALSNLQQHFEEYKRQNSILPRPGKCVPIKLASTADIDRHAPLARDFFVRILDMVFDSCFVSDQSSLWDFPDTEDGAAVFARIRLAYGVDVSDIQSGNLAQIFKRIDEHNQGRS